MLSLGKIWINFLPMIKYIFIKIDQARKNFRDIGITLKTELKKIFIW